MTLAMEFEHWKREGEKNASISIAKSMLEKGITPGIVVSCTNLSMECILNLQQELHTKQEQSIS